MSSLDLSLERMVQAAGNIPSSVVSTESTTMEDEAEAIYFEVDSIQGRMEASPVSHIRIELLDDSLATLDGVKENVENCRRMFNTWKRKHRADHNANLKQEVKESVDEMETAFLTYREGVADKKMQLASCSRSGHAWECLL